LRLISGICTRDPRQLLPQLIGRLGGFEIIAASGFLAEARELIRHPAIVPRWSTLTPLGFETERLEGHTGSINVLCLAPNGRLASGSWDKTIRLWDVATGAETARLEGHSSAVLALCLLPDGRIASGSDDNTIRLWDVATGAEAARLVGHTRKVTALCLLADGRIASGSWDKTIRLWDLSTRAETASS
jgi:WD40 repeat protein